MKYCIKPEERESTCYHEFYKGKWDEKSFWKEDSLLLHDDVLFSLPDLVDAIKTVLPSYDPYGITEVSEEEWCMIGEIMSQKGGKAQAIYAEIDEWAADAFKGEGCFTILGI